MNRKVLLTVIATLAALTIPVGLSEGEWFSLISFIADQL